MPLSVVITTDTIYQTFYDDYEKGKSFLHSHTYSGNALAASVALATLSVIEKENLCARAEKLQAIMMKNLIDIANQTAQLTNIRGIGAIVAADLITNNQPPRIAYQIFREAVKHGALLRPVGNTIYWLPPLNIEYELLDDLKEITLEAIKTVFK